MDAQITRLDMLGIDSLLLYSPIAIALTVVAITGVANAYNIIDGFNGLSSMVGIITLLSLGYMGIKVNDPLIISCSFAMVAAVLGFFILNYPRGLIFMGDGGAYLLGFWIATLSVLLVCRNNYISPWFALLVNAYPIWETIFTIYRRTFHQGESPGHPDGLHFHSLLFRRILNRPRIQNKNDWFDANAKTSPYLWILSICAVIPAILFWNSTLTLKVISALFVLVYTLIYQRIVCFKTPKWLRLG
jgi:UDP-N-acetylmuramyl pentapeptide phosphotransferase/UDP-N-acetylglucosamine-1-phosphate transferase